MPLYDKETNKPQGEIEIPDDVLAAADKVYAWLSQNEAVQLCGLILAD